MTEAQKEILIAKMLDAPSSLSDEELNAILDDEELRDIYAASALVSSAKAAQPVLDTRAEWERFRPRIRRKPSSLRWIMRVAAIFLGVIFASAIAGNLIDYVFTYYAPQPAIAKADSPQQSDSAPLVQAAQQTVEPEMTLKVETPKQKKHPATPSRHLAKADIPKPAAELPVVDTDIDIDEYLRIQQARIDNDLAVQFAEAYMEEYDDLVPLLDAAGVYNAEFDNAIQRVTME